MIIQLNKLLVYMTCVSVLTVFIVYQSISHGNQILVDLQRNFLKVEIQDQNVTQQRTCESISVTELMTFGRVNQYTNGVPRIIHYVYRTLEVPTQYSTLIRECMSINKDAKFVFWTDDLVREFVKKHFPLSFTIYSSYLQEKVERLKLSDINRYFIILKFGGIYVDMDTKCQKPFQSAMVNGSCILSTEPKEQSRIRWNYEFLAMNSLMACIPNHTFFEYLINQLTPADDSDILEQTGPILLTNLFLSYKSLFINESDPAHSVVLAHSDVFSPYTDWNLGHFCNETIDGEWQIQGCNDLDEQKLHEDEKGQEAVAIHLFLHLGYDFAQNEIEALDEICSTFDSAFLIQP